MSLIGWDAWCAVWLGPSLLVLTRVAGLGATAPAWGTPGLDWRIRFGLIGLVTIIVLPVVGPGLIGPRSVPALAWLCLGEGATGAAMGLTLALVIAAARNAGELVGTQSGLAPAALFDPDLGEGLNPLGHLYGLVALGTFLAVDGPIRLVMALVESYHAIPVGGLAWNQAKMANWSGRIGWALGLSLQAASPVAVALIVAGLALGLISRSTSGVMLGQLTWPIRSAVGLMLVLFGLGAIAALFSNVWLGVLAMPLTR